jgi:acetolactate synthase-1/3 small subunit
VDTTERHTIAVLVDNEVGVLARVIGLFSGRGYNIESLTVAEVDPENKVSRISVVTSGTPQIIEQIKAQLDRLVPIHRIMDLTVEGPSVERELALVDSTANSFVFEISGATEKINAFIDLMKALGLVEISRTGVVAIARGAKGF